jgi:Rubredoxin-like zinc ribbon domain (DUF35_N)
MKHRLILDYTIPPGDLAPYFEALQQGKAVASECSTCGQVAFPARAHCGACTGSGIGWVELNGTAHTLFRTNGPGGSFALVTFEGADTNSTVGLIHPQRQTTSGKLVAPTGEAPGLWLELSDDYAGEDDDGQHV